MEEGGGEAGSAMAVDNVRHCNAAEQGREQHTHKLQASRPTIAEKSVYPYTRVATGACKQEYTRDAHFMYVCT